MSATVTLHLPDDLHRRLAASAERHGLPVEQAATLLLDRALEPNGMPSASPAPDRIVAPVLVPEPDSSRRDAELTRIRAALGDLIMPVEDDQAMPRSALSAAELRARLPVLDPPLSQTVIEGRDDRF